MQAIFLLGASLDPITLTTAPVLWRGDELVDLSADLMCERGTALGVSDAGVVVGMAAVHSFLSKGFIWDAKTGGQIVGTLEGRHGGANRAINNAGLVVGESYFFGHPGQAHLVTPVKQGYETRAIGAPPPASGAAWAINSSGLIVGMATPRLPLYTAAVFTPDAEEPLIDLGTLPRAASSAALGMLGYRISLLRVRAYLPKRVRDESLSSTLHWASLLPWRSTRQTSIQWI